jgi:hypothetical protein
MTRPSRLPAARRLRDARDIFGLRSVGRSDVRTR